MSRSHWRGLKLLGIGVTLIRAMYASADVSATNDLPNPYRPVENWAQLPTGIQWGQVIGVQPDAHGNLWVFHRSEPPILEFDASGKFLKSFGAGMFVQPHGLSIDPEGNIWTTDQQGKDGKGQQAIKFSPDGKVLMTLGKAGLRAPGPIPSMVRAMWWLRPMATSSSPTVTAGIRTPAS
jgi:streptogramin lyase